MLFSADLKLPGSVYAGLAAFLDVLGLEEGEY